MAGDFPTIARVRADDLPITQVALQPLSREETLQLVESIVEEGEHGCRGGEEMREQVTAKVGPGGGACSSPGRGSEDLRTGLSDGLGLSSTVTQCECTA
jgi:hypothetical protein